MVPHLKIAYILNTYPQPSHSFIRREIQALERGGAQILRLAMRRADVALVDAGDMAEAEKTEYVLDRGGSGLIRALLGRMLRAPGRFSGALVLAARMARASDLGILRHLIYLAEACHVARRCRVEGVDHMHAHFGTNAAAVAMLAHALGAPGYSFTVHGPEEFDAPARLSLGPKLDRAAFAVGVSQFGRSQLRRWADIATWQRLKVVHCAIEPAAFARPAPLPSGALRLVCIGRFVEQKGQMLLLRAMVQVRQRYPDIHLTLVGDGDMRVDLEAAISAEELTQNITLTGWLDEAGVRAQLDAAHALIMPSFAEGLPMVVMEAMAAARPVIATYIAGIPELVLPGQTGWLVPAGDAGALAGAVTGMAQTPPPDLARIGQAGRERVLDRHDADTEAARLAGYFAEAIAGDQQGSAPARPAAV
jgi:glycosyltransferase involved in cell wall biosynthesis